MARKKTKKKAGKSPVEQTRAKFQGTPFGSAKELESASKLIHNEVWANLERARLFKEACERPEFSFIKAEFEAGLKCRLTDNNEFFVKAFSEGEGILIDINQNAAKQLDSAPQVIEALVKACGQTFSKSYYESKGLGFVEGSKNSPLHSLNTTKNSGTSGGG